ncbi:hypothetical protein FACS189413_18130 [Bacteroidia bacterium]|nr:hypothetical protein FACS189413_18130 [Bacteroidia bacterium]
MKKTIFILLAGMFAIAGTSVFSQNLENFVQFESGFGIGGERGFILKGEYGKTWKWLDVSLSMSYEAPWGDNSYYLDDEFVVNNNEPISTNRQVMNLTSHQNILLELFSIWEVS